MKSFSSLQLCLQRMPARVENALRDAVSSSAQETLALARACAPVRTGRLRASLRAEETGLSASVSADVPYALYAERHRAYLRPSMEGSRFMEELKKNLQEVL